MASKTLTNLTAATGLTGVEIVPVTQSGNTRKTTTQAIANLGVGTFATMTDESPVVHVNDFYPVTPVYDHTVSTTTQTPQSLGYSTIAEYILACPATLQSYFNSFNFTTEYGSSTMPSLTDTCDAIAWQAATNYIYDTRPVTSPISQNSAGKIIAHGIYKFNKTIVFNHKFIEIEGIGGIQGTTVSATSLFTYGLLDLPAPLWDFYSINEHGRAPLGREFGGADFGLGVIIHGIYFNGQGLQVTDFNGSTNQGLSNYIYGIRIRWSTSVEIYNCKFSGGLYDGIVFTAPGLFYNIERNIFYGVDRDAISWPKQGSNFSTTMWIKYNEFGAVGRYCILLDLDAITPDPVIMENSFESANDSYYLRNPEWFIHGVKALICVKGAGSGMTIIENNFYEGVTGFGAYDVVVHIVASNVVIREDGSAGSVYVTTDDPDQARSTALLEYMGGHIETSASVPGGGPSFAYHTVVAIANEANAKVTTIVPHGFIVGDKFYFTSRGVNGMDSLAGTRATVTAVSPTGGLTTSEFRMNVDTTSLGTFVPLFNSDAVRNKLIKGDHWYADITNTRNYRVGYRGKTGTPSYFIFENQPFDGGSIFIAEQMANTVGDAYRQCEIRNGGSRFVGIPTMPAVARDGRKMTPLNVAIPRRLRIEGANMTVQNGSFGQRKYDTYWGQTNSGSYRCNHSPGTWSTRSVVATLESDYLYSDQTQVAPNTFNGYLYQAKVAGTTGGSEPSWVAGIPTEFTITAIDQSAVATVTAVGHNFVNGNFVCIEEVRGMTQIGLPNIYTVTNVSGNNFDLTSINSTAFTAYTGGGIVYRVTKDGTVAWKAVDTTFPTGDLDKVEWLENGHRIRYGTAPPTTGLWAAGDHIKNSAPSAGHFGWYCSVAGIPGQWVEMT
jgi:hypothetical protein